MKVLIMPCGIGMGHTSRCVTIARKLEEEGVEVAFASYGSGYEMLNGYYQIKPYKLPNIKFYGEEGELDIKYTAKKSINMPYIFLKSIYIESRIIKKFKPDIILADSHYSVPITAKLLKVPCVIVTNELTLNFSDIYTEEKSVAFAENGVEKVFQGACKQCKAIIVPDIPGSTEIPPNLDRLVVHTGPFLSTNPEIMPSKEDLRKKLGFDNPERIVLVTVGGSEFGSELLRIICEASDQIKCDKIIIVTGPQITTDSIPQSDKIIKKRFLDDMMEWMKISDVVVSLAGHTTLMEIMSLGIPNIVIPIDKHPEQLKNTSNIGRYGITTIENIKTLTPKKIAEDINNLLDDPTILMRAKTIKEMFLKYNGTENAVEIIKSHAKDNEQPL